MNWPDVLLVLNIYHIFLFASDIRPGPLEYYSVVEFH